MMMMGNERTSEMEYDTFYWIVSGEPKRLPQFAFLFLSASVETFFFLFAFIPGARSISMGLIVDRILTLSLSLFDSSWSNTPLNMK